MPRRKPKKVEPLEIVSQCGVTIGDIVWCKLANGNTGYGRIISIHALNKEGPAITIYDEMSGAYRVGLISDITEADRGKINKLAKAKIKLKKEQEKK